MCRSEVVTPTTTSLTGQVIPADDWLDCTLKSSANSRAANTLLLMLTAEELAVLDFERSWWLQPGPKDQAIEFTLGLSAAAYYEMLHDLIEKPAAQSYDPLVFRRLEAMIVCDDRSTEVAG